MKYTTSANSVACTVN